MKIALVGPTYPFRGGISHYTTLLCQHLRERHQVRFFTFSRQYPARLFPGRGDRDETSQTPLRVEGEAMLDGVNPLTWLRAARAIRRDRPDLLVLQWTVSYWIPLLWILTRLAPRGTRTAMICHNASPHESSRPLVARLTRTLQRAVMGGADLLICHAASDEAELRALLPGSSVARVMLPSYAALAASSQPRPQQDWKGGSPRLLFFGFVRPYKGLDILLKAMPAILTALPETHLTVAGEWWGREGENRAIDSAIRDAVTILDRYISNEEMVDLFTAADVVVLPYRSATQSAVVQLAYGFGVPVITTDVGGLAEAVLHETSGFVVPPDDATALARAIIRYHEEGWREKLEPGVAALREQFSWAALIDTLERAVATSEDWTQEPPAIRSDD